MPKQDFEQSLKRGREREATEMKGNQHMGSQGSKVAKHRPVNTQRQSSSPAAHKIECFFVMLAFVVVQGTTS
jgi:hypothetical protein